MLNKIIPQTNFSSAHKTDEDHNKILDDYLDFFYEIRKFHMSRYMYGPNSAKIDWYKVLISKDYYYLKNKDSVLISSYTKLYKNSFFKGCTLYEIGPGVDESLENKTLPIINNIQPNKYVSIDISEYYSKQAAAFIRNKADILTDNLVSDAFNTLPNFNSKNQKLIVILGSTIGNLTDVELHNFFKSLSLRTSKNDGLLLTFDSQNDIVKLNSAYNNYYTHQLMLNIMRNFKENFDIKSFDAEAFDLSFNFNESKGIIELGLKSLKDQVFKLNEHTIRLHKNNLLSSVMSRKFNISYLNRFMIRYGFKNFQNYSIKNNPVKLAIFLKQSTYEAFKLQNSN